MQDSLLARYGSGSVLIQNALLGDLSAMSTGMQYKYNAFISYSHAADGKLVPALQSALHRFARPWYRMRALRIFRDETNLSISPALWPTIEQALEQSEFFILLASPRAASSKWVTKEVAYWLQRRSADTLLLVITDGDLTWDEARQDFHWQMTNCLPQRLAGAFKQVPHYLDFRWAKTATQLSLKYPEFLKQIADLASTLHRRSKDEMIGEDVRQHRRTKQISFMAIVSLLSLTALSLYQRSQAVAQRTIAVGRQLAAQSELLRTQHGRLIEQSALLAIEAMRRVPSVEANQALRAALSLLPASSVAFRHPDKVLAVALTADGKRIVTGDYGGTLRAWEVKGRRELWTVPSISTVLSLAASSEGGVIAAGFHDRSARLFESGTGQELARLDHEGQVNLVVFSPDGKYLLTSSTDAIARLWSVATGRLVARLSHEGKVLALRFADDSSLVVTGSLDGTARIWTVPEGRELHHFNVGSPVVNVAMTPDGRRLVTAGRESVLTVWEVAGEQEVTRLPMHAPAELLRVSPNGSVLAAGGGRLIQLWETMGWQQTDRLTHEDEVTALQFDPMGRALASASLDRTARLWDPATGYELMRVAHDEAVQDIAYTSDGRLLATASLDGIARIVESNIDVPGFRSIDTVSPSRLAISRDGSALAIGRDDGTLMLWDVGEHRQRWEIKLTDVILDLAFSPHDDYLTAIQRGGPVRIVQVRDGKQVATIGQELPRAASFSPNGRYLALGGEDHTTRLYQVDAWNETHRFEHRDAVQTIAFSPDGRFLSTGTGSFSANPANEAIIWGSETNEQVGMVSHVSPVQAVTFSSDGRLFATASQDFTAVIWKMNSLRAVGRVRHELPVWAVQFSADNRHLLTGSEDRSVRVWDVETAEELSRVMHQGPVKDVVLSPDGKTAIIASADGKVQFALWKSDDLIETTCRRLTRNMTRDEWRRYLPNEPYQRTCPNLPEPEVSANAENFSLL